MKVLHHQDAGRAKRPNGVAVFNSDIGIDKFFQKQSHICDHDGRVVDLLKNGRREVWASRNPLPVVIQMEGFARFPLARFLDFFGFLQRLNRVGEGRPDEVPRGFPGRVRLPRPKYFHSNSRIEIPRNLCRLFR